MTRFEITHTVIMFNEGFAFEGKFNGALSFSRDHIQSGMKEYVYVVQSTCEICNEPHMKKRGSPSKAHNECKMKPYRKDKNEY